MHEALLSALVRYWVYWVVLHHYLWHCHRESYQLHVFHAIMTTQSIAYVILYIIWGTGLGLGS